MASSPVMPNQSQFEQGLRRILWTLRDYAPDLMVIGGWVPHLYRQYGGFKDWTSELSGTGEVDVLVPPALPTGARPPISRLLGEAGFIPTSENPAAAIWAKDPIVGEH